MLETYRYAERLFANGFIRTEDVEGFEKLYKHLENLKFPMKEVNDRLAYIATISITRLIETDKHEEAQKLSDIIGMECKKYLF